MFDWPHLVIWQTRHCALLKIVEHSPTKHLIQPSCKIKETFNDVEKSPAIVPQNIIVFVQDASDYQLFPWIRMDKNANTSKWATNCNVSYSGRKQQAQLELLRPVASNTLLTETLTMPTPAPTVVCMSAERIRKCLQPFVHCRQLLMYKLMGAFGDLEATGTKYNISPTLRITGPCYRGVGMWFFAGVWDLQTTSSLRSHDS